MAERSERVIQASQKASQVLNGKENIKEKPCLGSSVVEHPAVNRQVVGSNPTLSAKKSLSG